MAKIYYPKAQELNHTPIYTPFAVGYDRVKTEDGVQEIGRRLKRYYSSIDAEVYLGNRYVEDICDIEWSVTQQNMPIFGFNSYTFDEISIGSRIVYGNFAIRFTNPNYLFKILQQVKEASVLNMSAYDVPVHDRILGERKGEVDKFYKGEISGTRLKEMWPQTFDIDIVYGKPTDYDSNEVHVVLQEVRIINCQSGASTSNPTPQTEVYQFVAKDFKTLAR